MSDDNDPAPSGSEQAWAKLADQFSSIARQFRQHYERVSASPRPEPEHTQGSVQRAASKVGRAVEDTARAIDESVRDPKVRQETGQAGSALLRAVGVTLTELGAALQREAETPPAQPAELAATAQPPAPAPTTEPPAAAAAEPPTEQAATAEPPAPEPPAEPPTAAPPAAEPTDGVGPTG